MERSLVRVTRKGSGRSIDVMDEDALMTSLRVLGTVGTNRNEGTRSGDR